MKEQKTEIVKAWVRKAENDIITARQTLCLPNGPTDTVCFHSQQAVEKTLKAILTYNNVEFPKIHNLVRLLDMVISFIPDLNIFREHFAEMSSHAIEIRYPDYLYEPTRADAIKALEIAEKVLKKVKEVIIQNDADKI